MTLRKRRWLVLLATGIVAGLLAFPLRGMIYDAVVVPAAFMVWNLSLFYRYVSQGIWWGVIVLVVFVMLVFSLIPRSPFRRAAQPKPGSLRGQVEELATALDKAERGIYFKWLVANRLGKLAHQILLQRESGRLRKLSEPLAGADWAPSPEVQRYLETGLHGSFADFPHIRRPGARGQKTPLDLDVGTAVDFLESNVENGRSGSPGA